MRTGTKTAKKILKWTAIALGTVVLGLTVTVVVQEHRTLDAPYPDIHASRDPALIARGRHLVHGPAHCVDCHADAEAHGAGERALSGGLEFKLPIGIIRTANITADPVTGIGALRDEEIARALRYGVDRHGHALMPFMPFADLSDEDRTAIVSYLRTLPPTAKAVRTHELNLAGRVVGALLIKPTGPAAPPPKRVAVAPTADYGRYLAHNVANCVGCHTQRSEVTGAFTGPPFAGGLVVESHKRPDITFVTPNLTPDPKTGRIANWNEETFVARFRMGTGAEGSIMPWGPFARMSDDDLKALYAYLHGLPAVVNDTGDPVRKTAVASRSR
jgi:mono/diheme cytochrome c family protein